MHLYWNQRPALILLPVNKMKILHFILEKLLTYLHNLLKRASDDLRLTYTVTNFSKSPITVTNFIAAIAVLLRIYSYGKRNRIC